MALEPGTTLGHYEVLSSLGCPARRPLETMASEVRVVLNWFEELERLVPTS